MYFFLSNKVRAGSFVILTGHAGDGKTTLLAQVLDDLGCCPHTLAPSEDVLFDGNELHYVKDFSELTPEKQDGELEACFHRSGPSILIANTGPLLNAFIRMLGNSCEDALLTAMDSSTGEEFIAPGAGRAYVLNIARVDNTDFITPYLRNIIDESNWESCDTCPVRDKCPIFFNRTVVAERFDQVSSRIENMYIWLQEYDSRATIRQLTAHLTFSITGGLDCKRVLEKGTTGWRYKYLVSNLFYGCIGTTPKKGADQIRGITLIKQAGFDKKITSVDYSLLNKGEYHRFPDRLAQLLKEYAGSQRHASGDSYRSIMKRAFIFFGYCNNADERVDVESQIFSPWFGMYMKARREGIKPKETIKNAICNAINTLFVGDIGETGSDHIDLTLPASTTKELNSAFALKDAEAFAWWITHESLVHLDREQDVFDYYKDFLLHTEERSWIPQLLKLGKAFQEFRAELTEKGFYTAIDSSLNKLIDEYISTARKIADPINDVFSNKLIKLTSCFVRWFTICDVKERFFENGRIDQVIVPPWHPATLEKIADQMLFIRSGLREWNDDTDNKPDVSKKLSQLNSLSAISNSTDGFVSIGNYLLTLSATNGYYTMYGHIRDDGAFTSAQTIERKETVFSDDFDDADLKVMSREAEVLLNIIEQYVNTYPNAKYHLNLAFVNSNDLQVIVAALSRYVEKVLKDKQRVSIELTVLLPNDSHGARTYLAYWINHAFNQDDDVDIKAYLRVYRNENEIPRRMTSTTDLTFFFDAMNTMQNAVPNFLPASTAEQMLDCRFPMVFKPTLKTKYNPQHAIEITQAQFRAALSHTQVIYRACHQMAPAVAMALQQQSSTDEHRGAVIAKVQEQTIWLCCIDSAMDKHSVRELYADQTGIIGFTTGEGSSGQMNLAITCRRDLISDITLRCKKRLNRMFPSWSEEKLNQSAQFCIHKAGEMDGVSILRAMNPDDYDMNNFMAYLIADELIERMKKQRCSTTARAICLQAA